MERLTFRYSLASLAGDYFRSCIGLALTALPASQLPSNSVGLWLLSGFAVMFAALALHTLRRQTTRIVMTDDEIELSPGGGSIKWKEVREVKLSYYSTRTDRKNGWMQLTICSGNRKVRIDSRIDSFQTMASTVLDHTRHSNVLLSETSSSNFEALGLSPSSQARV